jgi:hypothetical protein
MAITTGLSPFLYANTHIALLSRMLTALHVELTGCHPSFRKRHGASGFADTDGGHT